MLSTFLCTRSADLVKIAATGTLRENAIARTSY